MDKVSPPIQAVFEVAAICNLRCPQCWIGLRWTNRGKENNFMSMELFNRACDQLAPSVKHTYLHLWGEPTLNKDLGKMIRRAKEFSTVDLATHGLFIDESNIDDLIKADSLSVSIDGITQEVYEQYRVGGQLNKAMAGMRMLAKAAPGKVNWTFIVFKQNEHQVEEARKLAEEIGVNFGPKPPVFWDSSTMDQSMPSEAYRRYSMVNGSWELKADKFKCREFWRTLYLLPDGKVTTCCYDGRAEYPMGNIYQQTLLDIWNGEAYTRMRENHDKGILNEMCSKYCHLA